jgi:hypothetical protein
MSRCISQKKWIAANYLVDVLIGKPYVRRRRPEDPGCLLEVRSMPTSRSVGLGFVALGAAIVALIPVFLVLYPASGISQGDAARPEVVLPIMARNPALFVAPGVLELAGHAIGAVAMLGLWFRWGRESFLLTCATFAGLLWMSLDMVDNAVAFQLVPRLASDYVAGNAAAGASFVSLSGLVDAVRLSGHFGGGLWVAGISVFGLRGGVVHPAIAWTGIAVGAVLSANVLVPALLNVSFMTLPLWLLVFGVAQLRVRTTVAGTDATPEPRYAAG